MNTQQLYENAPLWLQNIAINVKGKLICLRRYNRRFFEELKKFEEHSYNQSEELRKFFLSAKDVAAYSKSFTPQIIGVLQNSSTDIYSILSAFPIINKEVVKARIGDFINPDFSGKCFTMRTSGTTGGGLAFPYPIEFENKQWAIWWRFRKSIGIRLETWCGWFGGKRVISPNYNKPPFWRVNNPGRQVMYSSYHLTRDTVKIFYDDIKKRNLEWLHGYPSHIAKLSAHIIDAGLDPIDCVRWVTTGAEGLVGNQIILIKKAFPNALIKQHYGQNEGVAILNQNEEGEWYVENDFSYVEFIPVKQGSTLCRIVGTGFFNSAFPLIRYDTGDLATVEWNEDGSLKKVISIDGRTCNTIKQPSGREITEAALSIVLHDFDNIKEAQFHQIAEDEVVLWVVKGCNYSKQDELLLKASLDQSFDKKMRIRIKYVEAVERTNAGKLRLVVTNF